MENTLSSLFASGEWRQLPWLQPSEAEAWFEARGEERGWRNKVAPNGEIVQMALREAYIYCWHFYVGQHCHGATNDQFQIISLCQRWLRLMKRDKSRRVTVFVTAQRSPLNALRNKKLPFCVVFQCISFKVPAFTNQNADCLHCMVSTQENYCWILSRGKLSRFDWCLCFWGRKRDKNERET